MNRKVLFLFLPLFMIFLSGWGQNLEGVKIYVNPGHGGFNSDDRNVPVKPFALGDTAGFWESKSNLAKGLHLMKLLQSAGAEVIMSRVKNRTEDDRPLSAIAEEANANQVDFMISIHSNAFNSATNYVLMLYHGWDNNPLLKPSQDVANLFWENLISNQTTHWTNTNRNVRGDKSFAPADWNGYGVLRPLTVPGLISEGSFHDYIPETYRLLNLEYKQLEAWHFYRAFLEYYEGGTDPNGKIAGYVKDSFRKVTEYPFALNSKDQWLPINGAKVTLQPGNLVYEVDSLNNGFFMFDNLAPGEYTLHFEAEKYEPLETSQLLVEANRVTYHLCQLNQDRSDPMKVENYAPKAVEGERVSAASAIVFNFNFEVDRESFEQAISIEPPVLGRFVYEDQDRTAKFVPHDPLEKSTLYTVTLAKSVKHIGNLEMEEDFSFSFLTAIKNRLSVLNIYPKDGDTRVYPTTQMRIHFDGRLKNVGLADLIRVEDNSGNALPRSNIELNTFSGTVGSYAFNLSGLQPGQDYFLKLDSALEDEEGLLLYEDVTSKFTVVPVFESMATVAFNFEESASGWTVDEAESKNIIPGTGNRILRYATSKLFGDYSYRLFYKFSADEAQIVVRPENSPFSVLNGMYAGLYIWGDLSDNQLVMLFEKDGIQYETLLTSIDFAGWQFREIKLEFDGGEGEYLFIGFKFVSGGTLFSAGGVIFLDNLLIAENPITSIPEISDNILELQVFPNPADRGINVRLSVPDGRYPYKISGLLGRVLQQGSVEIYNNSAKIELKIGAGQNAVLTINVDGKLTSTIISRVVN